jgi:AraC family transcriptional regulator
MHGGGMDRSPRASDRHRVERAVHYIAERLQDPLTVAEVAKAAGLSEFHFHRIFAAVCGESVGRFITRRRLEHAALRLAYEPHVSITDIALGSGYSSSSNFTKAFSAYFGCSPSRVRSPGKDLPPAIGSLTKRWGKAFDPRLLYALPPEIGAQEHADLAASLDAIVRFETSPGFSVACLRSAEGYDADALVQLYGELYQRARQIGICGDDMDAWGIAHDSPRLTAPDLCRYDACVPCPAGMGLPAPLFRTEVPAGRYAVFAFDGAVEDVEPTYRAIYSVWLPRSSLSPDEFSVLEHHTGDGPKDGRVQHEIWIKVRPRDRAG